MDPNGGLTAVGAATGLFTDMIATYKASSVHVFEIEKA